MARDTKIALAVTFMLCSFIIFGSMQLAAYVNGQRDARACWPSVVLTSAQRDDVVYVMCAAEDGGTRVVERK